jgi:eukaryotic-like serine/threonine-protein kinase
MRSADRLIEIFNDGKACATRAERQRFLAEACGEDGELKHQVLSLLEVHDRSADFLEVTALIPSTVLVTEKPGDRIGRYKLLEQIGEGGCGVVYMAEQEEPVRRRVALKVIKLGMDTKQVIARFEAERQALALMDHPNIAKVLDAGATDTGRPYFVMELVRGIRITDYCDQNNLSTNERLELFIQVCQAIQHAHQKGIIHRDIKPSNILVTQHDDVAVPKVIDFGIAKATVGQLTDKTVFTAFAQFIGTPAYMSPEQAQMTGLDIDTRADIYSLGVLLYELLTGNTPFDAKELLAAGLDEMRRKIREDEPARPSTCLSKMTDVNLTTVAKHRHAEPPKLIHLIRGDLDWLVMKCLEKDRTRRYETASGFAMDIQRHLEDEPVIARPPSQSYRFQKLVRRNKLAFAAASAVAVSLVIGLGIATWSFFREKDARQIAVAAQKEQARLRQEADADRKKAQREAGKHRQVAQFLENMLNSIDLDVAKGRDTTLVREMLDKTSKRIAQDLTNQPEVEASLQNTIGNVYYLIGERAKAEVRYRDALVMRRKLLGNEHPDVGESLNKLAGALWHQGKPGEAEGPVREAVAMRKKLFGNEHLSVAHSLDLLSLVLASQGKLTEAESAVREALATQRKLFGNEHLDVANSLGILSGVLVQQGRLAEAENVIREALAMQRKLFGDEQLSLADPLYDLANAVYEQGKISEAEGFFREALAIRRKHLVYEHPSTAIAMSSLATALRRQGKFAEAELLFRECLIIREKKVPDAWYTFYTRAMLGDALLGQKKFAEAESLLISGYEGMKQRADKIRDRNKVFSEALQRLVQLYEATGQFEKATEWNKKLVEFDPNPPSRRR